MQNFKMPCHAALVAASPSTLMRPRNRCGVTVVCFLAMTALLAACNPTVQLQAPEKPIEINMNVNIEHRIKIENDVKKSIAKNKDIF